MDTLAFFNRVIAHQGLVCLLELAGDRRRQTFYPDHKTAATAALALDAKGSTVYHACATFKTDENRKQENAAFMRSFWVDADVDPDNPEKYPDLKAALIDIARVSNELKLPMPLIIKSGGGAHAYWPLSDDLDAGTWQRAAGMFKSVLDALRFRQDRTRTADSSSVLRPAGTHWRKAEQPRRVGALSTGTLLSSGEFISRIEAASSHLDVRYEHRVGLAGADDLSAGIDYPPSSADRVIQFCPTLAYVAEQKGNVSEPLWRAMLGVVKFTTEGDQRCHEWSAGHPEYDQVQTQEKIDRWTAAPTTCAHFRGTPGNKCEGCPRSVTSPVQLGYIEQGVAPTIALEQPTSSGFTTTPIVEVEVPHWPKQHFHWNGRALCRAVKGDEGQIDWMPFCETKFYPTARARGETGEWELVCTYEKRNGQVGAFNVPTSLLGKPNELHAALAAQEVVMMGQNGVRHGAEFLREYMLGLQSANIQHLTYTNCGWADEYRSFIVGNRRLTSEGEQEILGGDRLQASGWNRDLGRSGSVANWTRLINQVYARSGAEPYQFVLMAAFASPLVELMEADNWHGIPIALVGETGLGKSTVCRLACSMYGHGRDFMMNAQTSGGTYNAVIARIALMRNLPFLLDEITKRDPEEIRDLLYGLSNGRPKERVSADGKLLKTDLRWNLLSFITSQHSIIETLPSQKQAAVVEATQIRIFEIKLETAIKRLWEDVNFVDVVEHQLGEEYGEVGRVWLPYLITNAAKIREEMRALRAQLNANDSDHTRERFYRDAVVQVLTATKHARKLGLIDFDMVGLAKWAKKHILSLRQARADTQVAPEDRIAHFLGSLNGHTIITQFFRKRQGGVVESPMEPIRGVPAARMALGDRIFLVSAQALADWCAENQVSQSWMLEQLRQRNYLMFSADCKPNGSRKERITRGTNVASSPQFVFELDYEKVVGQTQASQGE